MSDYRYRVVVIGGKKFVAQVRPDLSIPPDSCVLCEVVTNHGGNIAELDRLLDPRNAPPAGSGLPSPSATPAADAGIDATKVIDIAAQLHDAIFRPELDHVAANLKRYPEESRRMAIADVRSYLDRLERQVCK